MSSELPCFKILSFIHGGEICLGSRSVSHDENIEKSTELDIIQPLEVSAVKLKYYL